MQDSMLLQEGGHLGWLEATQGENGWLRRKLSDQKSLSLHSFWHPMRGLSARLSAFFVSDGTSTIVNLAPGPAGPAPAMPAHQSASMQVSYHRHEAIWRIPAVARRRQVVLLLV